MSNPFDDAAAAFREPEPKEGSAPDAPARKRIILREPGEYDIPEWAYHADPCLEASLSGSIVKVLVNRTARHAAHGHPRLNPKYQAKESQTFDLGKAFHKLILNKGAELEAFDAANWTKAGGAGREFKAGCYARGTIPLLAHQHQNAIEMVRSIRAQIPGWEELHYAMAGGVAERTLIWREETPAGPIWCRCMLDWIPHSGALAPDWKSTEVGAGPDEWGARTMWQVGADIQAAWNRRAIKRVLGRDMDLFFAVAENTPPFALACMRPVPSAVGMADRLVEWAISYWGLCLKAGRWPGYQRQMAWVEPPAWREKGILEREEREDFTIDTARLLLEAAGPRPDGPELPEDDNVDAFGLSPVREELPE